MGMGAGGPGHAKAAHSLVGCAAHFCRGPAVHAWADRGRWLPDQAGPVWDRTGSRGLSRIETAPAGSRRVEAGLGGLPGPVLGAGAEVVAQSAGEVGGQVG